MIRWILGRKFLSIGIILIGIYLVAALTRQVLNLSGATGRLGKAEQNLADLSAENAALYAEFQFRQTPEFIEQEARNKFSLVKEDEVVVILPSEDQNQEKEQTTLTENLSNFARWLQRLFGI